LRGINRSVCLWIVLAVALLASSTVPASAAGLKLLVPVPDRSTSLPAYIFYPDFPVHRRLPGVVVAVGAGSQEIPQYQVHCNCLANRGFVVLLIDPSNYPESLIAPPDRWDRGFGRILSDINQVVVAGKLLVTDSWYMDSIKAAVDFLWRNPAVDPTRLALAGHSQPANYALPYACRDRRIKAVSWNYGGSPWVVPYEPENLPPVQIFQGTADEVYDVKYGEELASELQMMGGYYEANIYPGEKHMFNVYYNMRTETRWMKPVLLDAFERLVSFLNRVLMVNFPPPQNYSRRPAPPHRKRSRN
jgi:dienelactone hydrolase